MVAALLAACGGGVAEPSSTVLSPAPPGPTAPANPSPMPSPGEPAPSAAPNPSPTAAPTTAPTAASVRFTGRISLAPAARVRFGPGLDLPVVDLAQYGAPETFDAWTTRPDEPPLTDAVTGRIEAWSRDWYHLASGGWVHAGAVDGMPPPGAPPTVWQRPAVLPASTAGIVAIRLDLQDQRATCEVAALRMALTAEGVSATETQLLDLVGVDDRPPEVGQRGEILRWGNPDTSFVGNPNGRAADYTGYGVYAGPVAAAATRTGGHVLRSGHVPAADLYAAVIGGHPAVAWVTSDYAAGRVGTWTAWDGARVRYALTEHAVTVIGVTPTRVLINDPWWGQVWRSRTVFETAYATFDSMAVVLV